MPKRKLTEDEKTTIENAKKRLEQLNKKFYSPTKKPMGNDPKPEFHDVILDMHFEVGETIRFIGCCPYTPDTPLDPVSGLHEQGFTTPAQHIAEINREKFGKRALILNISEQTTDNLTYFKVQFKDGVIFYCMPFEISKLFNEVDNICQTCYSKAVGRCRGSDFGKMI